MSDAEVRGIDNLVSQYADSINLQSYIAALMSPFNGMLEGMQRARRERAIEYATGAALDLIGDVVGAKRVVEGGASAGWWGYYEDPLALGNGTITDPTVGGKFYDLNLPISNNLQLGDEDYRKWIYGRILLNSRNRSVEQVIEFIRLLFLADPILPFTVDEEYDPLVIHVTVTGALSPKLRAVFAKRLPLIRPAGVLIQLQDDSGNIQLEF